MRKYTKTLVCPACGFSFTMSSPASKFCHANWCKNKRRRERRAELKDTKLVPLQQALKGD